MRGFQQESAYIDEVDFLQKSQYDALPFWKQYWGKKTVGELLGGLSSGEELEENKLEYIKIFANLYEYERARKLRDEHEKRGSGVHEFLKNP